LVVLDLALKI